MGPSRRSPVGSGVDTGKGGRAVPVIERASANDLMELASDSAAAPMQVSAVLLLDRPVGQDEVRAALAERVPTVPRLRQRLRRAPWGGGRPVWVDDPGFAIRHHVVALRCPAPGDEAALLDVVAQVTFRRLTREHPLWSVAVVDGLTGGRSALVLVMHHVLADGVGGLAALARLVDDAPTAPGLPFPLPGPSRTQLLLDAARQRVQLALRIPAGLTRLRDAVAELGSGQVGPPPRTSLNTPTGPRRRLALVRADLAAVAATAHRHGATVNDVLLTAVGGALGGAVRHRGEQATTVVISVPVSGRAETTVNRLGNQVGVMPVEVPAVGDPIHRLAAVAANTRTRVDAVGRGASAALLTPMIRVLARLRVLDWFISHQRLVTTVVTNVRGPKASLSFRGARITELVAVAQTMGNVTVAFAAISYAGLLTITVVADADAWPDLALLVAELQDQLDRLAPTGADARPR